MILDNTNNQRIAWIDILKGIGIIFVVLGHVIHNDMIFNWIYSFHMPLFFFASGCLYKKDTDIRNNIKRKFSSIMLPYFLFGFLDLIYWYLVERRFRVVSQSLGEAFWGLLSGEYRYLDFNVHLWFLPCFFLVVVTYNILNCLLNERWVMLICLIMAILYSNILLPDLIWGAEKICRYIIFFAIGNLFKKLTVGDNTKNKMIEIAAIVSLFLNIVMVISENDTGILYYVSAIFGILPWVVISLKMKHSKVLEYLSRISIIILCVHGPIYRVLIKIVSILMMCSTDDVRGNIGMSIFTVICTLLGCGLFNGLIRKWKFCLREKIVFLKEMIKRYKKYGKN